MSVKELRAELAARQYPIQGNKNTLIKQLQKARAEAAIEGSNENTKLSKTKKVEIIISEESWSTGRLMQKNTKKDEREAVEEEDVEEDEDEDEEVRVYIRFCDRSTNDTNTSHIMICRLLLQLFKLWMKKRTMISTMKIEFLLS